MTTAPEQLVLDLPHRPALEADDFLVSDCNAFAVDLVDRWPGWANSAVVVTGPAGSGKSHLVNVWRTRSGAACIPARDLAEATIACLESRPGLAVEDIDRGIGSDRVLFHVLNIARERKRSLLLTSRATPGELEIALPDLRSRLKALPFVQIAGPDVELLRALLVKLFADRQLGVEPHVVAHLARHMERTTAAAVRVVALLDHLALAGHRKVTRALAGEALAQLQAEKN
jgi:chromosomal replication initiation ATPase DnaA